MWRTVGTWCWRWQWAASRLEGVGGRAAPGERSWTATMASSRSATSSSCPVRGLPSRFGRRAGCWRREVPRPSQAGQIAVTARWHRSRWVHGQIGWLIDFVTLSSRFMHEGQRVSRNCQDSGQNQRIRFRWIRPLLFNENCIQKVKEVKNVGSWRHFCV